MGGVLSWVLSFVNPWAPAQSTAPAGRRNGRRRRRRPLLDAAALDNIGENFNKWRYPIKEFGSWSEEDELTTEMEELGLPRLDFDKEKWNKAKDAVDKVLNRLLSLVKEQAATYERLSINRYVKQGSSREGIKTIAPDEFDTLLLFDIRGLDTEVIVQKRDGMAVPELATIAVSKTETMETLRDIYPTLYKKGVFYKVNGGRIVLNTEALHEKVFKSMIDKAVSQLKGEINTEDVLEDIELDITRRINQPSVNITITLREADGVDGLAYLVAVCQAEPESIQSRYKRSIVIDVDIVPGWLVKYVTVPDPTDLHCRMNCPVYAVFKWVPEKHHAAYRYDDPKIVWRICSSGFEKHILDVASQVTEQRYIITALRILKAYMSQAKQRLGSPVQISTVLRSYFLKHIAFYCLLHLTVLNKRPDTPLTGVKESLGYLLDFLQICLEERKLPHFFHSNDWIQYIFPEYVVTGNALRYNLFIGKSDDALRQAELSLSRERPALRFLYTKPVGEYAEAIKEKFRTFVNAGVYYS